MRAESWMARLSRPRRLRILLFVGGSVWIALLGLQHAAVLKQETLMQLSRVNGIDKLIATRTEPNSHLSAKAVPLDPVASKPKLQQRDAASASATWNGKIPLWLDETPSKSEIHCVGDDNVEDSWMRRSCHITNLCYSMETYDYVVLGDAETPHVALGGINPRWANHTGWPMGIDKVRWKPKRTTPPKYVYRFDDSMILLPFHSLAAHNVGHLMWDDFYPLVSLANLFGFLGDPWSLLPVRHQLTDNFTLYASCDIRRNKKIQCAANLAKFAPMMGQDPDVVSKPNRWVEVKDTKGDVQSSLVCAKNALVGLGFLTDHGWKDHGWNDVLERETVASPLLPHNLGRGRDFEIFRSFVLRNLNVERSKKADHKHVSFSLLSSRDWGRRLNFTEQIVAVDAALAKDEDVSVHAYTLWNMTLEEQIQVAIDSDVWVTACGGGSMMATFLSPGSSLIVFYDPIGGFDFSSQKVTSHPARLDWDLLNNAAHLRVHWIPTASMNQASDLKLLVSLIRHELSSLRLQ